MYGLNTRELSDIYAISLTYSANVKSISKNSRNSGQVPLSAVNGRTVLMRQTKKEVLNLKITIEAEAKEISDVMSAMKNQANPPKTNYMAEMFKNILSSYEPKVKADNIKRSEDDTVAQYKLATTIDVPNKK